MSYEVYIDVRHHPKHLDDFEQRLSDCGKWVEPEGSDPSPADRMRTVVNALRSMADTYDPDVTCSNCGKQRHEHYGYPDRLVRCHDQPYGEVTQAAWWEQGA